VIRVLQRVVRAAWVPVSVALTVAVCTLLTVQQRHEHAVRQRLEARADVVAAAIRSIDVDASQAALVLDGALAVTDDSVQLSAAAAEIVEAPSLVSTIAIVNEAGAIVATSRGSTAIEQAIAATGGDVPTGAQPILVLDQPDGDRDYLVFVAASRTSDATMFIELTIDRTAFDELPSETAFTVTVLEPRAGGTIAYTDRPVSAPAVLRTLSIGGQPAELAVSGPPEAAAGSTAWIAAALAALCALALAATCRSAIRWRRERRALYHDDHLLDGAFAHQLRVEADLRISDTQLRAVLESTPDTVALVEPSQQRCRLLNRPDLLGHEAVLFERSGFVLTIAADDADVGSWWLSLSSPRGPERDSIEFWAVAADGRRCRLQLRIAALRGAGLSLQNRCVGVFTDITEQHQQRERESVMRDELERVRHLESLGRLSGGIAHDFRNVLAAVDINTELLATRVEPDAQRYIDVIQRASGRAAEMVRQLLSFAKRDLGETGVVDINRAVAEIETLLRSSVSSTVSLEIDLDGLPCYTRAARGDLDRLILNLVCNARDALPLGGIIRVTTARGVGAIPPGSPPREWVQLVVADNGVGIPDDIIGKVFDPFFTTKGDAGSGLGLATVHGIVSALGGHVGITSTCGRGTTVTVALPPEHAAPLALPSPHRAQPRTDGTRRVVLVDDDVEVREPTARLLRDSGFEVVEAATAYDGLEAITQCPPDVLVTDIVMAGGMNGVDLAELSQRQFPSVAVLLVSGYADAMIDDGTPIPHRLLSKPFSSDDLLDALDDILGVPHG
jgi:signal transduction histidine kinase